MPYEANPNDLTRLATVPDARLAPTHKTPLRTYSRRSLKRRHTSPPAQHVERFLTHTASLNVSDQKTAEQRSEAKDQQSSRPSSNTGRKRLRFSLASAQNKTPNDLAWEALASSAPVSTGRDDDFPDESGSYETHVVKCSPDYKEPNRRHPAVENVLECPTESRGGPTCGDAAPEAGDSANVSLEESDEVQDDSSDFGLDGEADVTALTSSFEGGGTSSPTTLGSQKPTVRGRFLIFDRSPPKGFKVLHKPRVNPETQPSTRKTKQELTDGFTEAEARPLLPGRRRRLRHLDVNVGSLDLTQSSNNSQQRQRDTSPEAKGRPQTLATAGLWRGRQDFSASQFKAESQEPHEFPEVKKAPAERHKIDLDRQGRPICLVDNSGTIVIPGTDSPRPDNTSKLDSSSGSLGELVQDSSPSMQLFPKRSVNGDTGKWDSLTLRPGPPSWARPGFAIPDTPLQGGDARP